MRPSSWLPPVLWMAVILALSSDSGSAENTGRWVAPALQWLFPTASPLQIDAMHGFLRKLGHMAEYAVLVALWARAFARGSRVDRLRGAGLAWAIAVVWAGIDEGYQTTVGSRTGSPVDVLIDAAGASLMAIPAGYGWRTTTDRLARLLLWIAAAGGAGLLILNVVAGVPSGVLWLTVPVAAAALFLLRRRRTGERPRP